MSAMKTEAVCICIVWSVVWIGLSAVLVSRNLTRTPAHTVCEASK